MSSTSATTTPSASPNQPGRQAVLLHRNVLSAAGQRRCGATLHMLQQLYYLDWPLAELARGDLAVRVCLEGSTVVPLPSMASPPA